VRDGSALASLPQAVLLRAAQAMRPGAALETALLTEADDYYYSHHREAAFPVLRARFALPDAPVFYLDPAQGRLAGHVDRDSRWNRWLFNGLHQLDFAFLRTRPAWDVVVIVLCVLGFALTFSGVVLGWRRLTKR
jgi:hypothetical protein